MPILRYKGESDFKNLFNGLIYHTQIIKRNDVYIVSAEGTEKMYSSGKDLTNDWEKVLPAVKIKRDNPQEQERVWVDSKNLFY